MGSALTYFAHWPAWAARLLVIVMVGLIGLAAIPHDEWINTPVEPWIYTDASLYKTIDGRVARGENYYQAAAAEQRAHKYPTAPGVAFREPTLAWLLSALRFGALGKAAQLGLVGLTVFLFYRELLRPSLGLGMGTRLTAMAVFSTGLVIAGFPLSAYMHEIWAAFMIVLSLLLYRSDRWLASLGLGLAACLFRELALPYLWVMAAFALYQRRWRELAGWTLAMVAFGVLFAAHLAAAAAMHLPGDRTSTGWLHFGGLAFVAVTSRWNLLLHNDHVPDFVVIAAICLGVLGLAGWRDPRASRAALTLGGYLSAFAVVGRPDTNYWGQLFAPLLPVGLILAPVAVRDLARRALPVRALQSPG